VNIITIASNLPTWKFQGSNPKFRLTLPSQTSDLKFVITIIVHETREKGRMRGENKIKIKSAIFSFLFQN